MNKYDIIFESDRIYYIKMTDLLIDDYLKMVNDFEVQKYITHNIREYSYEDEKEWIKINSNNNMIFSMIEKGTNEFIGSIELKEPTDIAELGICITSDKQDKGYGTESIKAILKYGHDKGIKGFHLNVFNFNPRAIRCYEKVGFVIDGPGKNEDDYHMTFKGEI